MRYYGVTKKAPERGDIYLFDLKVIPKDLAVFWVILHCHPEDSNLFFTIPADTNHLRGVFDIPIPPTALFGALVLRLGQGLWLPKAIFQPSQRVGIVETLFIDRAQFIMSRIAKNEWVGSDIQQANEFNPDYEEWMEMLDQVCGAMRSYREKQIVRDYITEGIKVFIDEARIIISSRGLDFLNKILHPQPSPAWETEARFLGSLMPAMGAIVTRGATRETTKKRRLSKNELNIRKDLKEQFFLIPNDFSPLRDKTLTIKFTKTKPKISKKPIAKILFKGKEVSSDNVEWQTWTSAKAVLLIKNCDIKIKETKKADTLMDIHYEGNILHIDILPLAPRSE